VTRMATAICRFGVYLRGDEGGEYLISKALFDTLRDAVAAASSLGAGDGMSYYVRAVPHDIRPDWKQSYVCWPAPD
jgi:hypothetical protein